MVKEGRRGLGTWRIESVQEGEEEVSSFRGRVSSEEMGVFCVEIMGGVEVVGSGRGWVEVEVVVGVEVVEVVEVVMIYSIYTKKHVVTILKSV